MTLPLGARARSITRRSRPVLPGVRIVVSADAVVVQLRVVRVGLVVALRERAVRVEMRLEVVAVRVRSRSVKTRAIRSWLLRSLKLCGCRAQAQKKRGKRYRCF